MWSAHSPALAAAAAIDSLTTRLVWRMCLLLLTRASPIAVALSMAADTALRRCSVLLPPACRQESGRQARREAGRKGRGGWIRAGCSTPHDPHTTTGTWDSKLPPTSPEWSESAYLIQASWISSLCVEECGGKVDSDNM